MAHIEIGKNLPSTSRLPLIAEALNIEVFELFIEKEIEPDLNKIQAINKVLKKLNTKEIKLIYDLIFDLLDLSKK